MIMDAKKLSAAIRAKKKMLKESSPEMIGTSPVPDMNAQDIEDLKQKGRIEETVGADPKINADDTVMAMSEHDAGTVGLTTDEAKRMGRLRSYIDTLDLSA
jgi:hypothetical protein